MLLRRTTSRLPPTLTRVVGSAVLGSTQSQSSRWFSVSLPVTAVPIVERAQTLAATASGGDRVAVLRDDLNVQLTYNDLLSQSQDVAETLSSLLSNRPAGSAPSVAFLAQPGPSYVVSQWAAWRAGGIAVPLCPVHPKHEMEYVVQDSNAAVLVGDETHRKTVEELGKTNNLPVVIVDASGSIVSGKDVSGTGPLDTATGDDSAQIIYTSGTTGRPKGVLTTHSAMQHQITCLVDAWGWSPDDHILHFLPLHHVHGIVNKLCCALWVGAKVDFVDFTPQGVWDAVVSKRDSLSVFMAVPTVYVRLIELWDSETDPEARRQFQEALTALRLMVCGSAPLPVTVLEKWATISHHMLLERYGMSEGAMFFSNPLDVAGRRAGCVGHPLAGVEMRLVDEEDKDVDIKSGLEGELRVKSPGLFKEYWNRPDATAAEFDDDGYFKTGDVMAWSEKDGSFKILGRRSVDIIKTSGHKISALEVERLLLELTDPVIAECAVLGIPDERRGEAIAAVIRLADNSDANQAAVKAYTSQKDVFGADKKPRHLLFVDDIPKNAMGKVNKKALKKDLF